MADEKVIAVVGATGAQGGGLVRAIQRDRKGGFRARALARDVNSPKAKALAALGAEVVEADLDDPESLTRAFRGAHGAYCVTFYWAHLSPEKEMAHAQSLANAAKRANVPHVIWSTLEDVRRWIPVSDTRMPTLMGNYKVPHLDAKGASDHFFTDLKLPVTFFLTSFYWDNLYMFGMGPKPGPDGTLVFGLPMANNRLAGMGAEDIGKCAYGVFKRGREYIGKTVGVASEHLTGAQMAASLSTVLGRDVRYQAIPPDVYRSFGFPGADDLGNMFQFYAEFETEWAKSRDIETSRALNPELQTFDQWLVEHKALISIT